MNEESTNLKERIIQELLEDPIIDATRIEILVDNKNVTISGVVPTVNEKKAAVDAVRRISGIDCLNTKVKVDYRALVRSDEGLYNAARKKLSWCTNFPVEGIKMTVSRGWFTLEGELPSEDQKKKVVDIVKNLPGVPGVTTRIKVKRKVN